MSYNIESSLRPSLIGYYLSLPVSSTEYDLMPLPEQMWRWYYMRGMEVCHTSKVSYNVWKKCSICILRGAQLFQ